MAVSLYITVALCALLAALLVYRYDLYEREPWYWLLLAGGLGFGAMHLVALAESATFRLGFIESAWAIAGVAALEEEVARLVIVIVLALVLRSQFNDPMDGIVYGSMVGLGMGVEESFHYLNFAVQPNVLSLPVELVRLLGHLILGGFVGYGAGLYSARLSGWAAATASTVALAIAVHFTWDVLALEASGGRGTMSLERTAGAIALMVSGMLIYGALVVAASSRSRDIFAPDSEDSLWGWPFPVPKRCTGSRPGPRESELSD